MVQAEKGIVRKGSLTHLDVGDRCWPSELVILAKFNVSY